MIDQTTHQLLAAQNARLEVGTPVHVRWGYGLNFRAEGKGKIVKVFEKSVQVQLDNDVPSPYTNGAVGWPAGFVLKGIPRYCFANLVNGKWGTWHSVTPVE